MKNTYFIISLFLLIISCTVEKKNKDLTNCVLINASISEEYKLPFNKYYIDVKLIPLETSKECLIGTIQSIIYKNDRFYIKSIEDNKILKFDIDGRYVGK